MGHSPDSNVEDEVLARFGSIRSWGRGKLRAPHKPLLLLIALAALQRGQKRLAYADIRTPLKDLLLQYGPVSAAPRPFYPYWRLNNDVGLWEVERAAELKERADSSGDVREKDLMDLGVKAGFPSDLIRLFAQRPHLLHRVAHALLEANFPHSIHEDILDAVGFQWEVLVTAPRARRDPAFRDTILTIYERRCAMCGFDARLGDVSMGLEAAHVRWHSAGGPDTADNGLCLCTLHHKAFDCGALAVSDDLRIHVSARLTGSGPVGAALLDLAGKPLRHPQTGYPSVLDVHAQWHREQVFKGPGRVNASG